MNAPKDVTFSPHQLLADGLIALYRSTVVFFDSATSLNVM